MISSKISFFGKFHQKRVYAEFRLDASRFFFAPKKEMLRI